MATFKDILFFAICLSILIGGGLKLLGGIRGRHKH